MRSNCLKLFMSYNKSRILIYFFYKKKKEKKGIRRSVNVPNLCSNYAISVVCCIAK